MAKGKRQRKTHTVEIEFSDENVTSFGGMILEHRLAERLGLWTKLHKKLPERSGKYSWMNVIQATIAGLLTGGRGTFATEELRGDDALLELLDLDGAPEEATLWRCLEGLGEMARDGLLGGVQAEWTRAILEVLTRRDLLECDGFFPIFADGSLLEGSARREGTKAIPDKGRGLMWATIFAGPLVAAQALAREGEGEQTLVRRLLPEVMSNVVEPLKLKEKALFLADSLHGDGPTLDLVEELGLSYVVGAGGLEQTGRVLAERSACEWIDLGPDPKRGWSSSEVCVCWIQCDCWEAKRLLVGRRVTREGELFPMTYGVLTNLTELSVGAANALDFAVRIWRLYDAKGSMELGYKELLSDLGLHHPPCGEHVRNAGFYATASLAHTLAMGVKLIGAGGEKDADDQKHRESQRRRELARAKREGVPPRVRVRVRRGMRLWRVRRRFFSLPARVSRHARRLKIEFLGVCEEVRRQFQCWYRAIQRC